MSTQAMHDVAARVSLALVHYPVVNKRGEVITSSLTNLDIHDLVRIGKTYGLSSCYFVTPLDNQREIAATLNTHWRDGFGKEYNPDRSAALELAIFVRDIAAAKHHYAQTHGVVPELVATSAKRHPNSLSFGALRDYLLDKSRHFLLVFGTSSGLSPAALALVDGILEPIETQSGYNHLSVRSAVSIIVDRLLGQRGQEA